MIARLLLFVWALLALAACQKAPTPAAEPDALPAIWEIAGADGEAEGWLFGTVHALPDDVPWRSARLERLLAQADTLVVEVAALDDADELGRTFTALAYDTPGPALAERVEPALRPRFEELLAQARMRRGQFDAMESWAAALSLAQVAQVGSVENGVDKALLRDFTGYDVVELEGAQAQLAIFDRLPENAQRELLNSVIEESGDAETQAKRLVESWRSGDLAGIKQLTNGGMLEDGELYEALLARRNRAWADRLEKLLSAPARPFVAVGAGHMVGPDGLPTLLEARGYTVRRVQ